MRMPRTLAGAHERGRAFRRGRGAITPSSLRAQAIFLNHILAAALAVGVQTLAVNRMVPLAEHHSARHIALLCSAQVSIAGPLARSLALHVGNDASDGQQNLVAGAVEGE